jgi:serine phosphatase RsbU (regulator of sigma subunit)
MDEDEEPWLLEDGPADQQPARWPVLIVDDEPGIHEVTIMVLSSLRFSDRGLEFLRASSCAEAQGLLAARPDIAVALIDVVMEREDSGLTLVRYIREELGNRLLRIILRTGQAGQAPERDVVLAYDINDYKEKTELTAQKLWTVMITALRGYQTLTELAAAKQRLEAEVAARTAELQRANQRLSRSLAALQEGERAGRRIQFKLLPPARWQHAGLSFEHRLMPSDLMSGDFVDYFAIDAERVGFYIADVAGHGVASAFVTVYLKRFVASALETHRLGQASPVTTPARLLESLNRELLRERVGKHIAIFYAVLDASRAVLTYANAGATPYPMLAADGQCRLIEARSTPAGLFERSEYTDRTLALPARFELLLCSDGVLELLGTGTAEGCRRLCEALPGSQSIDGLLQRLGIRSDARAPDDVTLLRVSREAP